MKNRKHIVLKIENKYFDGKYKFVNNENKPNLISDITKAKVYKSDNEAEKAIKQIYKFCDAMDKTEIEKFEVDVAILREVKIDEEELAK